MHFNTLVAALTAASLSSATIFKLSPSPWRRNAESYHDLPREVQASNEPLWPIASRQNGNHKRVGSHTHRPQQRAASSNPFVNRKLTVNPSFSTKLQSVHDFFVSEGDTANAGKVKAAQTIGTFYWVSEIAQLSEIDRAISAARHAKNATGEDQIVGLVLYNLPDRDCSAGESSGELDSSQGGLERYKNQYIRPFARKLRRASDVNFAIVVEPDAVPNIVTNQGIEACARAAPVYEAGIAHAIASLQLPHVHLYLDAAHGGWLGWDDNLEPAAKEFAKVVELASGNSTKAKIRGFSTNVSNYNPFNAVKPEPFTEGSRSYDESNYVSSLAPHLEAVSLPDRFIIDQSRVARPGARAEWGDWCNIAPSGFGQPAGVPVNNTLVDSIVWVKPGGESDGECGLEGAPPAGEWFIEFAAQLTKNASPFIKSQ